MEDIANLANKVLVLAQGKILFTGAPRELFQQTEILNRAGLEPPPITQLMQKLSAEGFKVKLDAINFDEAVAGFGK